MVNKLKLPVALSEYQLVNFFLGKLLHDIAVLRPIGSVSIS